MNNVGSVGLIVIVVIILVIGGGAFFMLRGGDSGDDGGSGGGGGGGSVDSTNFDEEWNVFQSLLSAVEDKNKAEMDSLFYLDYFDFCEEAGMTDDECWSLIGLVLSDIGALEKNDFSILGKDDKQTIIASDITTEKASFIQHHIYFVRNNDGLIVLSTSSGYYGDEEMLVDGDADGLSDRDEICRGAHGVEPCIESNPNNPDTDGDGWWDGVEDAAGTDPNDANDYLFK